MKRFESVNEWLRQVATGQRSFESVHLDELEGGKYSQLAGLELVRHVRQILLSAVLQLRTSIAGHGIRRVVVYLPVDVTDELMLFTPEIWRDLTCADEPPSLYVLRGEQVFDEDCEEYRRPVLLPIEDSHNLQAIFRSFRDQEDMYNSWEFTSGIYIIASLD